MNILHQNLSLHQNLTIQKSHNSIDMSQVIKITLLKGLAVNAAKNDTFKTGVIDKAADQKNVTVAYHESAGDEQYDERNVGSSHSVRC